ncbi:MAG: hypothetical protein CL916_10360 [Deltaproteobacteria bacterium]|nr:hypothetical protein [Deltaproteobacteria bacterium]
MNVFTIFLLGTLGFAQEVPHLGSDGAQIQAPLSLAVTGNLCTGSLFSSKYCPTTLGILRDIREEKNQGLVLLGNFVKSLSPKIWSEQISTLLNESTGMSMIAIPGSTEYKNKLLNEFGDIFGTAKQDIGLNRFAGWQHARLTDGNESWTVLFLDSHKNEMGTKWEEQKQWLSSIVEDNKEQIVIFMDQAPQELSGKKHAPSQELLDVVYQSTGLSQVRLVVFSGSTHIQSFLPETSFDALYLGCGGGGKKAIDLNINNKEQLLKIHPLLQSYFYQKVLEGDFSEDVQSQLMSSGDYVGKTPKLSSKEVPAYGWCSVSFDNGLHITQRHTLDGDSFATALSLSFTKVNGWSKKVSIIQTEESPEEPK